MNGLEACWDWVLRQLFVLFVLEIAVFCSLRMLSVFDRLASVFVFMYCVAFRLCSVCFFCFSLLLFSFAFIVRSHKLHEIVSICLLMRIPFR